LRDVWRASGGEKWKRHSGRWAGGGKHPQYWGDGCVQGERNRSEAGGGSAGRCGAEYDTFGYAIESEAGGECDG
jgi:hypothetical protein